jgi:hypothetical protein
MVYNGVGRVLIRSASLRFGGAKGAMRMPGPFPGMDPYLEDADLWRDLHHSFITYARAGLRAVLPPGYLARIEERVVILPDERSIVPDVFVRRRPSLSPASPSAPDAAVMEREDTPHRVRVASIFQREYFINIVDANNRERVITSLELLSPTNKAAGYVGRTQYVRKQEAVLNSATHLLECDLLRGGQHTVAAPLTALEAEGVAWDYLACLHRAGQQRELEDEYEVWFIGVRQPLPRVRVPLDAGTPDVLLDLQAVLDRCYDEANYGGELDYAMEPIPPLRSDDAQWADALLRERGLRP